MKHLCLVAVFVALYMAVAAANAFGMNSEGDHGTCFFSPSGTCACYP